MKTAKTLICPFSEGDEVYFLDYQLVQRSLLKPNVHKVIIDRVEYINGKFYAIGNSDSVIGSMNAAEELVFNTRDEAMQYYTKMENNKCELTGDMIKEAKEKYDLFFGKTGAIKKFLVGGDYHR